ncbi:MAG: glycosyltransferase family 4 protein [Pseudonocardiales bacterium]|nr:glycosyltransferase family 4 protein [Pseudonocardiales bacterium]
MTRIAVVTPDVLSARMAGPAIRAFHVADELSRSHDVRLISTAACDIASAAFECRATSFGGLRAAVGDAEVVVLQGYVTYRAPWLLRSDKILVVDLYDPMHLEQLEQLGDRPPLERRAMLDLTVRVLNEQLVRGDFFLCASEEQRHLWIGHLGALGRLNPLTYEADSSLRSLIDVCPFGLPTEPPARRRPAIKGVVPGIGTEDKVILWAGGVYNWFDPLTLIRAVDRIKDEHSDVKLFFLGMKHPNPDVPDMAVAWQTRQLAGELGLTGKHVFFNEGWVDYDDRQNYLLDADVGVSTHFEHVETTFSFRTRILDYLWAGLPVVATGGDTFGALIAAEGLGVAVAERDVDDLVAALTSVLYDPDVAQRARENVARVRERFTWSRVLRPLRDFCEQPRPAADAGAGQNRLVRRAVLPANRPARLVFRGTELLRHGGARAVAAKLLARARRAR